MVSLQHDVINHDIMHLGAPVSQSAVSRNDGFELRWRKGINDRSHWVFFYGSVVEKEELEVRGNCLEHDVINHDIMHLGAPVSQSAVSRNDGFELRWRKGINNGSHRT